MRCIYCNETVIKKGKRKGIQKYQCKACKCYQQAVYTKQRINMEKYHDVKRLNNEGNGISNIARLLEISKSSVQRVIIRIASALQMSVYEETGQCYQVDELRTYCGNKGNECWVMYGINPKTGKVIASAFGRRTKENIKKVIDKLLTFNPKRIYTDGLNIYPALIPKAIHRVFEYCTNNIERYNLTLRTHLKRLCRKTICFTKSIFMLEYCVSLYFVK